MCRMIRSSEGEGREREDKSHTRKGQTSKTRQRGGMHSIGTECKHDVTWGLSLARVYSLQTARSHAGSLSSRRLFLPVPDGVNTLLAKHLLSRARMSRKTRPNAPLPISRSLMQIKRSEAVGASLGGLVESGLTRPSPLNPGNFVFLGLFNQGSQVLEVSRICAGVVGKPDANDKATRGDGDAATKLGSARSVRQNPRLIPAAPLDRAVCRTRLRSHASSSRRAAKFAYHGRQRCSTGGR
ncbi:hypothetical protein VTK26DRAFT_8633 [Humicola hyalothermophila]